ncbi:hypothetical protein [Enterococcus larvae]|uniref:hypothetical protein n=1 Tax=Enterococcus larvae TaxID=2794352 RepID=UPI003F2B46CC
MNTIYNKAKTWIYRNARPIDLLRWQFLFENGNETSVLLALETYQNEDGGFGHGLESDYWNPYSSPMQTWAATEILFELNIKDKNLPLIQRLLNYLDTTEDVFFNKWPYSIPTNNDFPHAPWWHCTEYPPKEDSLTYYPTACFAGFILAFSDPQTVLFEKGKKLAQAAIESFLNSPLILDMHELQNYVRLTDYIRLSGVSNFKDYELFIPKLQLALKESICYDIDQWAIDYVCMPSQYLNSPESDYYTILQEIAHKQYDFLLQTQNEDGTWDILWEWGSYPAEFAISRNWWKSQFIINYMKYIRNFCHYPSKLDQK